MLCCVFSFMRTSRWHDLRHRWQIMAILRWLVMLAKSETVCSNNSARVLQILEATLGGTRRYLEDVFIAVGAGSQNGLVYSLDRADHGFLKLLARLRCAGWQLFELDMRRSMELTRDFGCVRELRNIFRAFQPDVVHAHASKAGAITRLATFGMKSRPAVVYSPHSISVRLGWVYRVIEHALSGQVDVLAAVTTSERDELRSLKLVPLERIRVIPPSIRAGEFTPRDRAEARKALGMPGGPLLVAVGRLVEQKDPLAFVDLIAKLRARFRGLRAIWVGDGQLRRAMEQRIAQLNLKGVLVVTGWVHEANVYLAASDIVVSTSLFESFGYATAEAFAMRRPVVASAVTGTVDVINGDAPELLYSCRDLVAAARLVETLLLDTRRASALAFRGRKHVLASFSTEETRRALTAAYAAAMRQ